jgi:broad specificity phosphatase PhoE
MLYFIRHGQTDQNKDNIFCTEEVLLNHTGVGQAKNLAHSMTGVDLDLVVTSPLVRARETAEIIIDELDMSNKQLIVDTLLREVELGVLTGKPSKGFSTATIPSDTEGAETHKEVFNRAERLLKKYKNTDQNTLLVGHSGIYRFLKTLNDNLNREDVAQIPTFEQG